MTAVRGPNGRFVLNTAIGPKRDKVVTQALSMIRMAKMAQKQKDTQSGGQIPALPAKSRSAMGLAEKLDHASNTALDRVQELLDREIDPTDTKTLGMQTTAALTVLGYKIRLDTERMREQWREPGPYEEMFGGFEMPRSKSIEAILHEVAAKEEDKK